MFSNGCRILVPVDGSDCSLRALDFAADLAAALNGEVVVCTVVELGRAAVLSGGEAQLVGGVLDELETEAKEILASAVARVGARAPVVSHLGEGEPVDEIDRFAGEIEPAFVVIGSHGRTGLKRLVMGSVAEGVVHGARVPVMVVPQGANVPSYQVRMPGAR